LRYWRSIWAKWDVVYNRIVISFIEGYFLALGRDGCCALGKRVLEVWCREETWSGREFVRRFRWGSGTAKSRLDTSG
jgi:hypothetical protein